MRIQVSNVGYVKRLGHKVKTILLWDILLTIIVILLLIEAIIYPHRASRWITSIDWTSITVIAGLVIGSSLLESSGALHSMMISLQSRIGSKYIYPVIIMSSGLLASIVLNDAAVFVSVPAALSVSSSDKHDQAMVLVLVLAAINIGSALTPFGNPQDVIITQYYNLRLLGYLAFTIPIYLPILLIIALYSMRLRPLQISPASLKVYKPIAVLGLVIIVTAIISSLTRQPIILVPLIVLSIIMARDSISAKDLSIIPLLIGIFAIITTIDYTPHIYNNYTVTYIEGYTLSLIISNVPATIALLGAPWKPLHLAVNLAGAMHPYSSLANLIGLRLAGQKWSTYMRKNIILAMLLLCYGFIVVCLLL